MKKNNTIIGSALLVMIVVLGSKVLGFLRQMVIAATYGSDIGTDIYFLSSDFIIGVSGALLASLSTALVTVYIDITVKQSREKANQAASKMLTLFLAAGGVFVLLLNIFAPFIAKILAPSYTHETLQTLTDYLRFFSIAFIFTAFQAVYAAVLNADNSFVPGKLYGMLYNPIAIIFVLLFADKLGIKALMAAYVVGNLLHTLCLKFFSRNTFKFSRPENLFDKTVGQLLVLTLPLLLSNFSVQLNNIVDKSICSLLGEGFASSYSYAYTLEQFITATLTATLSLVLLSRYSTYASQGETEKLIKTFKNSLGGLIILLIPITVIVAVMSYDIVSIVYLRGEFTADAALHTSHALLGLCIGFSLIAVREMYVRLSFAYHNTKTPMIANLLAVILNLVLSLVLSRYLGIFGVTLATSLCVILTIVILNKSVKQYISDFKFTSMFPLILKVIVSSVVCLITALVIKQVVPFDGIARFIICSALSAIAYLACLLVLRCDELNGLIGELRLQIANKFNK